MKPILTALCIFCMATPALADDMHLGVGLQVGDTTGITGKGYLDADDAVQVAVGFRPIGYRGPGPLVTADWLHTLSVFGPRSEVVVFGLYAGAGAAISFGPAGCYVDKWGRSHCADETSASARVPLGIGANFPEVPLEAFLELTPSLRLVPEPGWLDIAGVIGARFYF